MKKLLGIVVLGLLLSGNANAEHQLWHLEIKNLSDDWGSQSSDDLSKLKKENEELKERIEELEDENEELEDEKGDCELLWDPTCDG